MSENKILVKVLLGNIKSRSLLDNMHLLSKTELYIHTHAQNEIVRSRAKSVVLAKLKLLSWENHRCRRLTYSQSVILEKKTNAQRTLNWFLYKKMSINPLVTDDAYMRHELYYCLKLTLSFIMHIFYIRLSKRKRLQVEALRNPFWKL